MRKPRTASTPKTFFLDFETTGLDASKDHVLEVGLRGSAHLDRLVSDAPEATAPALRLHGLTKTWREREGLPGATVLDELLDRLGETPTVVAHNAAFERAFLEAWVQREGAGLGRTLPQITWQCTLQTAFTLVQRRLPSLSLGALATRFGWDTEGLHRAGTDAALTEKLWNLEVAWEGVRQQLGENPGLVYLAGPFRGDGSREAMEANVVGMKGMAQWAQAVMPKAALIVPHLNLSFLDEAGENGAQVRETVLSSCEQMVRQCRALIACGECSPGMAREIECAQTQAIPVLRVPGWRVETAPKSGRIVA